MRWLVVVGALTFVACGTKEEETPAPAAPEAAKEPAKEAPVAAPAPTAPPAFGKVDAILGAPVVKRGNDKLPATVGMDVQAGDEIDTPAKAKIRLVLSDQSVMAIGPDSQMRLAGLDTTKGRKGSAQLLLGKFWMQVSKWTGEGESFWEVQTPNAVAGVRGTTLWGDVKVDAICSLDGTVEVTSVKNPKTKPVSLPAGHCASKLSKGKLAPLKPKPKQVAGFLKEVMIEEKK